MFRAGGEGPARSLHLSWGIAEFGGGRSIQEAIALADAAMYERRGVRRVTEAMQQT